MASTSTLPASPAANDRSDRRLPSSPPPASPRTASVGDPTRPSGLPPRLASVRSSSPSPSRPHHGPSHYQHPFALSPHAQRRVRSGSAATPTQAGSASTASATDRFNPPPRPPSALSSAFSFISGGAGGGAGAGAASSDDAGSSGIASAFSLGAGAGGKNPAADRRSSFSLREGEVLGGRNYHFQTFDALASGAGQGSGAQAVAVPSSYTASTQDIRGNTTALASMALSMSDSEDAESRGSRVSFDAGSGSELDDVGEDEEGELEEGELQEEGGRDEGEDLRDTITLTKAPSPSPPRAPCQAPSGLSVLLQRTSPPTPPDGEGANTKTSSTEGTPKATFQPTFASGVASGIASGITSGAESLSSTRAVKSPVPSGSWQAGGGSSLISLTADESDLEAGRARGERSPLLNARSARSAHEEGKPRYNTFEPTTAGYMVVDVPPGAGAGGGGGGRRPPGDGAAAVPDHNGGSGYSGPPDDICFGQEGLTTATTAGRLRQCLPIPSHVSHVSTAVRKLTMRDVVEHAVMEPIRLLPAVVLGLLLNILDGVSYGMIMFPTGTLIFSDFGGDGVSMFFVTCIVAQLVYTLGGSIFKGGNGSMMIEVVPFLHIIVEIITRVVGEENGRAIVATTMVAFALSAILTGLVFFALGKFRLGVLITFFPRHILVGCIGGVGVFLIITGLEVTARLEGDIEFTLDYLRLFFGNIHILSLWLPPFLLAVLLRVITQRFHHPLVFPVFFLCIPIVFYIVVFAAGLSFETLRKEGWVFDVGQSGHTPWWRFYTYYDFRSVSWKALWATMPTQLALTFFGILHVPLNVPALGISIGEDNVDTDRELVAHGISNLLAGVMGTVPNYLCYVNSVLFYKTGGGSRLSGLMLAAATFGVMVLGPGVISYLPIIVVGALIFVLGIDLTKEAVWDTWGRVNKWEYVTIVIIVVVMTLWDFVIGIGVGIIFACVFFVVQNSRGRTIRATLTGASAKSTVRRHPIQRAFLKSAGAQTQILKLQGFLFFGTISSVEQHIRKLLDIATWQRDPIRFLIVDFTLVTGLDFSAAEAFMRIQRLLSAKDVLLVFCGAAPEGEIGHALQRIDLWAEPGNLRSGVCVLKDLNEALEWTENSYLRGMYSSQLHAAKAFGQASFAAGAGLDVPAASGPAVFSLSESYENSPRRVQLHEAAKSAIVSTVGTGSPGPTSPEQALARPNFAQPLPLLLQTFRAYTGQREDFFWKLVPYFKMLVVPEGQVLWREGDEADSMYLIESGILKAKYSYDKKDFTVQECMLAGTLAGELSFLSRHPRNTTVAADVECTLWQLDADSLKRLEKELPSVCSEFVQIILRVSVEEQDVLMGYMVSQLT